MMKRLFKSLVCFILAVSIFTVSLSLTSCGADVDREYDSLTVEREARALLEKCVVLNTVYYGRGISYLTSGFSNGSFYEADLFHLTKLGFTTISELETMTKAVYSEDCANDLLKNNVAGYGGSDFSLLRYYQKYEDELNQRDPICIMVNSTTKGVFDDRMTYKYDTVKAVEADGDLVFVTVEVELVSDKGETQTATLRIALIEELSGWRIASHTTFANYNPYRDKYDGMK